MHRPRPPKSGIVCALWTPWDNDGNLDRAALKTHLAFLNRSGIHGLLALGSTGEFPHLSLPQRIELIHAVVESAGALPVLINVSDVNPRNVCALARAAESAGCAGIAVLPPWYFELTQDDILSFFLRIAESTSLPFFLYNFPERVSNRIAIETIAQFADRAPLAGVKQSGAEWEYHRDLVALGRERSYIVYTGGDTRFDEALKIGCAGCISGIANFAPEAMTGVFSGHTSSDAAQVAKSIALVKQIGTRCGALRFPLDVGAGVKARGFEPGAFKQIVSPASQQKYDLLTADLRTILTTAGLTCPIPNR